MTREKIVYVDDFDHNLGPAITGGWTVIHVTDPVEVTSDLSNMITTG